MKPAVILIDAFDRAVGAVVFSSAVGRKEGTPVVGTVVGTVVGVVVGTTEGTNVGVTEGV